MSGRARLAVGVLASVWLVLGGAVHAQAGAPRKHDAAPPREATRPSPSTPDPVDVARAHFRMGIESYTDGDFGSARIEFKRAYAAVPNYRLLYNLGQVSQELRDYPAAEQYYQKYLEEGAAQLEAARKQEVERELNKVRARIASVVVTCNVDGAALFVDDLPVGTTPLGEALRVSSGQRRITGKLPGAAPITQVVDAAGGETVTVHLVLPVPEAPAVLPAPIAVNLPIREQRSHVNPLALSLIIGTVAAGAATGVFAYLAEGEARDYRAALTRKTNRGELESLADGARQKALVTDILLGVTAAGAVASGIVLWQQGLTERDTQSTTLRIGPGRVVLAGRF
ncbi:MAG: hypothetical protein ABW321_13985 [Polyangiales bacterium]